MLLMWRSVLKMDSMNKLLLRLQQVLPDRRHIKYPRVGNTLTVGKPLTVICEVAVLEHPFPSVPVTV